MIRDILTDLAALVSLGAFIAAIAVAYVILNPVVS